MFKLQILTSWGQVATLVTGDCPQILIGFAKRALKGRIWQVVSTDGTVY